MIAAYNYTDDDPPEGGAGGSDEPTPRMYRRNARKDFLNFAKCKKRTVKKIRKTIKKNCNTSGVTLATSIP